MTSDTILKTLEQNVNQINQKFHIRKLGLFGSYARGDARTNSDIDVLVEFEKPTFDGYMELKFFLEDLFHKDVDLVMKDSLKPRIKPSILAEVQYVQRLQMLDACRRLLEENAQSDTL